MRVCVIGTRGFPKVQGGVESHCQHLYPELVRLGCEIICFTRKPYVDTGIKEYKGVALKALPAIKQRFLEAFLHTFIGVCAAKIFRPDILHIQGSATAFFAPLAKLLSMKVVVTSHGPNYKHLKWGRAAKIFLKFSEFIGIKHADEIIAISETIAAEIKARYGKETAVIPNGVSLPGICESAGALERFGLEKEKYALAVGRFVREKGFHDLIDAFSQLSQPSGSSAKHRLPTGYKLVIAGRADHEGDYSRNLEKQAQKNKNIILTGFLTGHPLKELYRHAGIFVLPSYYEGLPIVLLEAMSYGLSCLVSDIPANREIGLPAERYFPAGDIGVLARMFADFAGRPPGESERRQEIKLVSERYSWDRIAAQTLAIYRKILSR